MDAEKFGAFVAERRKAKGMTQAELAKRLKVTDKAVSRWERGLGFPDIGTLEPLAEALGVSILELMKCQKLEKEELKIEEAAGALNSTFDLAKHQKAADRRRIVRAALLSFLGFALIIFGWVRRNTVQIIGSADGPTSIFIAGKVTPRYTGIVIAVGVILLAVGVWNLLRRQR